MTASDSHHRRQQYGGRYLRPVTAAAAIAAGASLDISGPSNETVTFTGGTGSLVLNQPESFSGQIVGFTGTAPDAAHSDTIDLVGIDYDLIGLRGSIQFRDWSF